MNNVNLEAPSHFVEIPFPSTEVEEVTPQPSFCRRFALKAFSAASSVCRFPETWASRAVTKIMHLGEAYGLSIRAAKIALVAVSSGILVEFGTFVIRQSVELNDAGLISVFPARCIYLATAIGVISHCVPLEGIVKCRPCLGAAPDQRSVFDTFNASRPMFIFNLNLITTLQLIALESIFLQNRIKPISPAEIGEISAAYVAGFATMLVAAGLGEMIKQTYTGNLLRFSDYVFRNSRNLNRYEALG